jgi:putative inorganic carbon (HCO3(-)) transporter
LKFKIHHRVRSLANKIDRWQWVILILSSPLLFFPDSWKCLILIIVPLLWINTILAGRNPLPSTPINLSVFVLVFMMLVSLYATYDISLSLPNISNMVFSLGAFFLIVRKCGEETGWWYCLGFFLLVGIGVTGLSALGTNWFTDKFPFLGQIAASFPKILFRIPGDSENFQPNIVSGTLIWILPMYLALTFYVIFDHKNLISKFRKIRFLGFTVAFLLITLVIFGIFILAQSRSGYLGFLAAFSIILFLVLQKRRYRIIYLIIVVIMFMGLAMESGKIVNALSSMNSFGETGASFDTLQSRMELWSRAIYALEDFPFTGIGMGTFPHIVPVLYPLFTVGPDVIINHAHNEFLQVSLELGIPGLIAFIAVYLACFFMIAKIWSRLKQINVNETGVYKTKRVYKYVVIGLFGGLLAHMFFGLTDAVFLSSKPGFIFWLLVGLITGLYQRFARYPNSYLPKEAVP